MSDQGRIPDPTRRRSTARRDLLLIASVAAAVFCVGVLSGLFDRALDGLMQRSPIKPSDLLALAILFSLSLGVFAYLRWRQLAREQRLRVTTERRFQTVVEQVPAVTYTWDPTLPAGQSHPIYVSPQLESMLGYTPDEWRNDPELWLNVIHPEDRDGVREASDAADRDGSPFLQEYRVRTKDGRTIWLRDESVVVARRRDGRPSQYQGVMFDITETQEARAQLQAAEERYRSLVENLPVVTYVCDVRAGDGSQVMRYIAPNAHGLTGFTAEDWLTEPGLWERLIHLDDRDRVLAESAGTDRTKEPFDIEYRMVRKDGSIVWVHDRAMAVHEDDGTTAWQGVLQDVTVRRHAQERLYQAEERFRTLVEQLPAVTYVEDPVTHRNLYISPQIVEMFGYSPQEWQESPDAWKDRLHPDDRDRVLAADEADTGDQWSLDYRTLHRDGRVVWIHNEALLIRDGDGSPLFWQGVVFDITERMQAEERLREAERRYRVLVEQLPVAVYVDAVDDLSTALYISPQYERLTGYSAEQRLSDPDLWVNMLHPDDRERVVAESMRTNATGDPFDVEYRVITADGRTVRLHDHAFLVDGPGGKKAWQGVLTDITERTLAQAALGRRDRILEAAGFAAERFLKTSVWSDCIGDVLERLGRAGEAGRAFLYENVPGGDVHAATSIRGEWRDPSAPAMGTHPDLPFGAAGFDRWQRALSAGEVIHGPVRNYPEAERAGLEGQGIRSCIVAPVFVDEVWWGYIGFDHGDEREWQPAEIDALRVAANTLGAAIGRERAAQRLSETETRYRSLIEQIPAITYMESAQNSGQLLYISPQVESMMGYPPSEWRYERWVASIHPDDREAVLAEDARTNETGDPFSVEYRMQAKDGHVVWVRDEAVLLRDDQGVPLYWQGVRLDITARHEAEEQLREAEERYRQLVEQMPAITYLDEFREDHRSWIWPNAYISPQVERILGYSPEEWHAEPELWETLVHPEDLTRAKAADEHHHRTGEPLDIELRVFTKSGELRWIRDQSVLVRDADGTPRWCQGILSDVTEAKRAGQALHEAEARYRSLIETIPAATYIDTVDVRSQAVYMSPQVEKIYGYTPEEWRSSPELWEQGLHPDDHDEVVARVDLHNRESVPYEAEYRFRHRDGRWVWVHDEAVMLLDETGKPRFSQGVVFDITEQKRHEERLRDAEERFRGIVEHIPSAIYLDKTDASMESVYVSPQIQEMIGVTPQEWLEVPDLWLQLMDPDDRETVREGYLRAIESHEAWAAEYRLRTRDGRTIWVHDETTFLHDGDGNPTFMQGVISDITERKLAEEALRASEQREREAAERLRALDEMKNTFLAAVSHELRSPLTSILGLSLTLERTPQMEDEDRDDLMARLSANARKLDRLLKDLLDIDRLNRGIVEPQYRATDVGVLASRTVESLESLADRAVIMEAEPVVVRADPAKVERIVENLLMNAARHTTRDRRIWLRVSPQQGGVLIVVEDDGPGVPAELREVIFEPFRQGPTPSAHAPGTGIGLSLVARFAALHEGRAWVEEREGGGASFRVFLPAGPSNEGTATASNDDRTEMSVGEGRT